MNDKKLYKPKDWISRIPQILLDADHPTLTKNAGWVRRLWEKYGWSAATKTLAFAGEAFESETLAAAAVAAGLVGTVASFAGLAVLIVQALTDKPMSDDAVRKTIEDMKTLIGGDALVPLILLPEAAIARDLSMLQDNLDAQLSPDGRQALNRFKDKLKEEIFLAKGAEERDEDAETIADAQRTVKGQIGSTDRGAIAFAKAVVLLAQVDD